MLWGSHFCRSRDIISWGCILANEVVLYSFVAQPGPPVIRTHTATIPGNVVTSNHLRVTFRNTSTDNCGLAAVFNVRLQRVY